MRERLLRVAAAVALVVLIGVTTLLFVGPEDPVLIRVSYEQGNAAFIARESVYLEVGSTAWDAHFAEIPARGPIRVRLVGTNTCRTYAEFVAAPGSRWAVRLHDDGTTTAEEGVALEASSANGSRKRTIPCPGA